MYVAAQPSEEAKPVGAYRPPAYRAPGRRGPATMGKSKTPEIDSEIAFPSLSASMASAKGWVLLEKQFPARHALQIPRIGDSLTSPYGHLSITGSSFGPRNAKNHTFPTSIIRTPL